MVAVVSTNNIRSRDNRAPAPKVHPDGSNYPWRMFFDNNQRIVDSDTTGEALDFLIPNYTLLSKEEKAQERMNLAQQVQLLARGSILSGIDPYASDTITEWEWSVLTYGDENNLDPFGWEDGTGTIGIQNPDVPDRWNNSQYPLVLVDTSYVPFTDIRPPLSSEGDFCEVKNIIWIRPSGEEELLRTLSRIGYITFGAPAVPIAEDI